jgi:hypothetical protein
MKPNLKLPMDSQSMPLSRVITVVEQDAWQATAFERRTWSCVSGVQVGRWRGQ